MGIITGPNRRPRPPRLPGGRRGPGSPVPHPPPTPWNAVPAASGRGHLAFLGPGAPLSQARWARIPCTVEVKGGGGGGVSPRFLGVQARAPGRLWSLLCPWGRRGDSGVAGRKKGRRGFGTDTARDTSAMGLGAWCWTSQSLSLGDKGGESWRGEGARRGQGCFPSEFKVADGGFGGLEWAGGAGVARRRAGKSLFGASAPGARKSCQCRMKCGVPPPTAAPGS